MASPITPSGLPYLTDCHVTHVTLLRTDSTRPRVSGQKRACSSLGVRPGNVALPVKRSVSAVESRTSRIPNEPLGDDAPVLGRQAPRQVGSKPILYLEYTDVPFAARTSARVPCGKTKAQDGRRKRRRWMELRAALPQFRVHHRSADRCPFPTIPPEVVSGPGSGLEAAKGRDVRTNRPPYNPYDERAGTSALQSPNARGASFPYPRPPHLLGHRRQGGERNRQVRITC